MNQIFQSHSHPFGIRTHKTDAFQCIIDTVTYKRKREKTRNRQLSVALIQSSLFNELDFV